MHLSDHSLQQLDEAYPDRLDEATVRGISARLLSDSKAAREQGRCLPNAGDGGTGAWSP